MATKYIGIYCNDPTANAINGTALSENSDKSSPLYATLEITTKEVKYIKCAIRTEPGYVTIGATTISFTNDTKARWYIAADAGYDATNVEANATFSTSLTISNMITDTNTIFWIKVMVVDGDVVSNDTSVNIKLDAVVGTV